MAAIALGEERSERACFKRKSSSCARLCAVILRESMLSVWGPGWRGCWATRNAGNAGEWGDWLVASGAEDGDKVPLRLWDLRSNRCIRGVAMVDEAANLDEEAEGSISSIDWVPMDGGAGQAGVPGNLLFSKGTHLYELDLRRTSNAIVRQSGDDLLSREFQDEINQISVARCGAAKSVFIACADDMGAVSVGGLSGRENGGINFDVVETHSNICMSAQFNPVPSRTTRQLISGGMDSIIISQEVTSEGSCRKRRKIVLKSAASSSQVVNPPFINRLSFSPLGDHFAAAVGDGTVALYDAKELTLVKRFEAHSASTSQVTWCKNNQFFSSGNDGFLCLWDVSTLTRKDEAAIGGNACEEDWAADMNLAASHGTGKKKSSGSRRSRRRKGKKGKNRKRGKKGKHVDTDKGEDDDDGNDDGADGEEHDQEKNEEARLQGVQEEPASEPRVNLCACRFMHVGENKLDFSCARCIEACRCGRKFHHIRL